MTASRPLLAVDAEIELAPEEPGAVISPHLYGHFIEHLGGVIYDGVWVGRNSKIPNVDGIRKQFVDDMKRIGAPNLRWPGGCFADGYHWRDGIGKAARRPRTYNFWQRRMPAGHTPPKPTVRQSTNSCTSAAWSARNPTSPRMSDPARPRNSTIGFPTATRPRGREPRRRARRQR